MGSGLNVILFHCNMVASRPYEVNTFDMLLAASFSSPLPTNGTSGCAGTSTTSEPELSESTASLLYASSVLLFILLLQISL